ncbi:hypothetical protein A5645_23590 [Mycobacterium asiaticum]|uniref:hypothetical protein n=1 Tax=Mycobacterium asiaticum TaxID=1790 RepID=UPI0007EF0227|nr:hypothetical protein [Mycobacterium asiaticum]OBK92449.1 hypothetical protein A5645_23590 [Mycobacterium asiaticum]
MSQPPEYPGNPSDPQGGHSGYPPPPGRHSAPPPDYGQAQGPPPGQSGGYQAPGYTAPPPPPYGGPGAPPPPPPGYPAGFGGGPVSDFSVGNAFSWAWAKFTQNIAALAVPTLIYFVALGAVIGIPFGIAMATSETTTTTYDYGSGYAYEASTSSFSAISYIVLTIGYIAAFFVAMYMQAALVTGALEIADGRPVSIGTFFKPRNVGGVLLATLLLGLAAVLTSCTFVGPLIITFFAQFAIAFVVDKGLSPVDSIKASFATVRANLGPSALSWLVQYAVVLVGEIACFVGLIAALPVASLIQVYTYRKLTGGQVVEDSQQQPGYPAGPPPGQYPGQQYA